MNNENQNLQGELNDEALDGVAGGRLTDRCIVCGRETVVCDRSVTQLVGVLCSICRKDEKWKGWLKYPDLD